MCETFILFTVARIKRESQDRLREVVPHGMDSSSATRESRWADILVQRSRD